MGGETEMSRGNRTSTKVTAIGLGALLAPMLLAGAAHADPDHRTWAGVEPIPPATPSAVSSELLARGAAGEFRIRDEEAGVRLGATEPTDVAMVRATLAPRSSTGWHGHGGPSMVIVASGTLRMIEPGHEHDDGCTDHAFEAGTAFAHPSGTHDFANDGDDPVVFYLVYFVPEGSSPAPVAADAPHGC
jgi:quercetin dioxygenase-like cupin family protein